MKTHKHTIHHYEDEPELLKWIPGVLFNNYYSRFPDLVRDDGAFEEHSEARTTFELYDSGGDRHIVEYRVYNGIAEFNRDFEATSTDIALIDWKEGNQPRGRAAYSKATKRIKPEAVFVLTSFPTEVTEVPEHHVFPKPVDVTLLMDCLIENLGIGV